MTARVLRRVRAVSRPSDRRPRRAPRRPSTASFVLGLPASERSALVALLRDELDRGWIPTRADLDAALDVVRARPAV